MGLFWHFYLFWPDICLQRQTSDQPSLHISALLVVFNLFGRTYVGHVRQMRSNHFIYRVFLSFYPLWLDICRSCQTYEHPTLHTSAFFWVLILFWPDICRTCPTYEQPSLHMSRFFWVYQHFGQTYVCNVRHMSKHPFIYRRFGFFFPIWPDICRACLTYELPSEHISGLFGIFIPFGQTYEQPSQHISGFRSNLAVHMRFCATYRWLCL